MVGDHSHSRRNVQSPFIPRLSDPARYGADPSDSFDVIVPSLPGFGFSDQPRERGWTLERTAEV
jgi:pimeloyl-ACP methyl ester carboxylesterase